MDVTGLIVEKNNRGLDKVYGSGNISKLSENSLEIAKLFGNR